MEGKHTPGRLVADPRGDGSFVVRSYATKRPTCSVWGNEDENEANATLYAAAPDMLAALRAVVQVLDGSQPMDVPGALMVARHALARATGGE